jgi:hypothetical protein
MFEDYYAAVPGEVPDDLQLMTRSIAFALARMAPAQEADLGAVGQMAAYSGPG